MQRTAEIFQVLTAPGEYSWHWQPQGGPPINRVFENFFDCLQDARTHEYEPQFRMRPPIEDDPLSALLP